MNAQTKQTWAQRLEPLNSSRLLFKIIVGVLAAILVIETILTVPSAIRFRNESINKMKLQLAVNLVPMITQYLLAKDYRKLEEALIAACERGFHDRFAFTVYGENGNLVATTEPYGVMPEQMKGEMFRSAELITEYGQLSEWDTPADFLIPIKNPEMRLIGVLRVSRPPETINSDVLIYLSRIIGLVVIIMLFVGISTVGYLYVIVVRPLHLMMRANEAATQNDEGRMYIPNDRIPNDEIGDIIRQRNVVLRRLRESQRVLEAWSQELEEKVQEKTAELQRAQQHLIHSEKLAAVGQLAAGVAHEINNPLATIAAYAEELLDQLQQPEVRRLAALEDFPDSLKIIEEQAYRCKRITKQLLNFARETEIHITTVDLNATVHDTLRLVRKALSAQRIALTFDLDPDMPPVQTDGVQVQQVIVNLITNAADAVGRDGVIEVVTRAENGWAAIEVRDNGPGIAPEIRDRVFDPFFTTKPVGHGTGLGLSICYGIIAGLGGAIEFACPAAGGTVFTVRLPLAAAETPAEAHALAG